MVYLLVLLLIFGLLQSLLELKKDKLIGSKWTIEKTLSVIYILGFCVGFVVIIRQNNEDAKSSQTLENISFSVRKIDSTSYFQLEKLSKSIEETEKLLKMTDSLNTNLGSVIGIRESLIAQTHSLNKKLASQIENDKKLVESNRPVLALLESDMKWIQIDSASRGMEFCLRNLGNRSADIISITGNTLFFNRENHVVYNLVTLFNTVGLLQATNLAGQKSCPFANQLKYQGSFSDLNFVAIYIKVKYLDVLDNSSHEVKLFSGWTPNANNFTKLRDWQKQIVESWLNNNNPNF